MSDKEISKSLLYSDNNISQDLDKFNYKNSENSISNFKHEEEVELSESRPSEAYNNHSSDIKQCLSTPNLIERNPNKRKSSLKKRSRNELFSYNSGSTYS